MKHTADDFSEHEWTAFWRENNERHVMSYTSIFKGTIRKHEWKGQYSNYILERQVELAPKGTLKVHEFRSATGESWEPAPVPLARSAEAAMVAALEMFAPRTDYVSLP